MRRTELKKGLAKTKRGPGLEFPGKAYAMLSIQRMQTLYSYGLCNRELYWGKRILEELVDFVKKRPWLSVYMRRFAVSCFATDFPRPM